MKNKQGLPIPFLILILAGVVSLFSIAADPGSRASMGGDNSLQMQTVEQERMAEIYFRILSWLSDVTPRAEEPAKTHALPAPMPKVIKAAPHRERQCKIELCTFRSGKNPAANEPHQHNIN